MDKHLKIGPGETKCEFCGGVGEDLSRLDLEGYPIKCNHCLGSGKINWIEQVFGKLPEEKFTVDMETLEQILQSLGLIPSSQMINNLQNSGTLVEIEYKDEKENNSI